MRNGWAWRGFSSWNTDHARRHDPRRDGRPRPSSRAGPGRRSIRCRNPASCARPPGTGASGPTCPVWTTTHPPISSPCGIVSCLTESSGECNALQSSIQELCGVRYVGGLRIGLPCYSSRAVSVGAGSADPRYALPGPIPARSTSATSGAAMPGCTCGPGKRRCPPPGKSQPGHPKFLFRR